MEDFVVHFFTQLRSLDWKAIVSLGLLGIILIIANAITHYIKERITGRIRDKHDAKEIIDKNAEPMRRRADDLIARLCTLQVGWANLDEMRWLRKMIGCGDNEKRLETITQDQLKWIEVVAFRILEFHWSVHRFRTNTQSLINNFVGIKELGRRPE
jgi:hypothetical protein